MASDLQHIHDDLMVSMLCVVPSTHSLPVDGRPLLPPRTKGRLQRRLYKPHKQGYGRPNHFVMMPPPRRNIPQCEQFHFLDVWNLPLSFVNAFYGFIR